MRLSFRVGIGVLVACAFAACGRTEENWWSDLYASDADDVETVDTSGSESAESESAESESAESESNTTSDEDPTESTTLDDTTESTTLDDTTESTTEGCQPSTVDLLFDPPTVVFLIEQASHMNDDFAGISRWEAVGMALFAPGQVAATHEDEMRLGLTTFTSLNGSNGGTCPMLAEAPPASSNAAVMETVFAAEQPVDENPVGEAVTALTASLAMDASPGSKTIVLLTARNPDTCAQPNPQMGSAQAQAAVDAAFQAGIGTRLIAMGGIAGPYAQSVANLGVGLPAQGMTMAPYFTPGDVDELTADLGTVLAGLRPCSFALAESLLPDGEQACTLELDGQALTLDDPDGWTVEGTATLVLQGEACTGFQQLGTLPELTCECEALP